MQSSGTNKHTISAQSTILFISQFRFEKQNFFDDNFLIEKKLLPLINQYCISKKYSFFILGSSIKNYKEEKIFFESIINSNNWKFLKPKKYPKNYYLLDKFENIVFVDSTLGYEAITREKKVAVFSSRKLNADGKSEKFGWPFKMKSRGLFYSNSCNYSEV